LEAEVELATVEIPVKGDSLDLKLGHINELAELAALGMLPHGVSTERHQADLGAACANVVEDMELLGVVLLGHSKVQGSCKQNKKGKEKEKEKKKKEKEEKKKKEKEEMKNEKKRKGKKGKKERKKKKKKKKASAK